MRYLFALCLVLPLAACATLDEDECRDANWVEIGKTDGANGRTPDYIEKHARACNKFGIAPHRGPWEKGRQQGIPLYCTPFRAWAEGADGKRLSPVCPAEGLDTLEHLNFRGRTYHRIGQDIADAEREISRINARIASLPADDPARRSLASRRAFLRLDIASLRAERALYRY